MLSQTTGNYFLYIYPAQLLIHSTMVYPDSCDKSWIDLAVSHRLFLIILTAGAGVAASAGVFNSSPLITRLPSIITSRPTSGRVSTLDKAILELFEYKVWVNLALLFFAENLPDDKFVWLLLWVHSTSSPMVVSPAAKPA